MAVRKFPDAARYDTFTWMSLNELLDSAKNRKYIPGMINAGVYLFQRSVLKFIPEGPSSLEKDLFPNLLTQGMYALEQHGMFIDIGTPKDYARAQRLYKKLYRCDRRPAARVEQENCVESHGP